MSSSFQSLLDQAMSCIERYAEEDKKMRGKFNDNDCALFENLRDHMAYYCKTKAKMEIVDKSYMESLNHIQGLKTADAASKTVDKFEKVLVKNKNLTIDLRKNPRYQEFFKAQGKVAEGDEEVQMVQSSRNVIDPFSRARMTNPVKNSQCGHHYEESVVFEMLRKNNRIRCAIAGCPAFIEKKVLVADEEFKRYLLMSSVSCDDENSQIVSLEDSLTME